MVWSSAISLLKLLSHFTNSPQRLTRCVTIIKALSQYLTGEARKAS